ncbi:MAG TPA: hypothetical protein VGF04_00915 [Solirubrobacterales bacterium]
MAAFTSASVHSGCLTCKSSWTMSARVSRRVWKIVASRRSRSQTTPTRLLPTRQSSSQTEKGETRSNSTR